MSILLQIIFCSLCLVCASAQGTYEFRVNLLFQPDETLVVQGNGWFFLTGNSFDGRFNFGNVSRFTEVRLENSSGSFMQKASRTVFPTPGTAYHSTWDPFQVTDGQITELLAEDWSVTVITVDYPDGIVSGQLQLIPEPSTLALCFAGFALLAVQTRRRSRKSSLPP